MIEEKLERELTQAIRERDDAREALRTFRASAALIHTSLSEENAERLGQIEVIAAERDALRAQLAEMVEIHTTALQLVDEVGKQRDKRREEAVQLRAQVEALKVDKERLMSVLEYGWTVIANAGGGDWSRESLEWQTGAETFRDDYHAAIAAREAGKL